MAALLETVGTQGEHKHFLALVCVLVLYSLGNQGCVCLVQDCAPWLIGEELLLFSLLEPSHGLRDYSKYSSGSYNCGRYCACCMLQNDTVLCGFNIGKTHELC